MAEKTTTEECVIAEFDKIREDKERIFNDILLPEFNKIQGNTYQEKLDTLNDCHCCMKHQINKPSVFGRWVDTPTFDGLAHHRICQCNCRHMARFICRQAE